MNARKQAPALALGLALALGAGGTGVTLAQELGGMMGDDHGAMDREHGTMGPGMGMGEGMGMGPGMGMMPGMGMGPGMRTGPGMQMMQEMHAMREMLSAEQRAELRELMQEHRPAQYERMGQMMNLREDLMDELAQDRPDPETVEQMHGRMAEIHGAMLAEQVRMRNAMHELLTDEQREQLRERTPLGATEAHDEAPDHEAHHPAR